MPAPVFRSPSTPTPRQLARALGRHRRRAATPGVQSHPVAAPVDSLGAARRHLAWARAEVADAERALDDVHRMEPLDLGDAIQAARRLARRSYRKAERALGQAAQARAAGHEALARAYERLARSWRWGGDLDARAGHLLRHNESTVVRCRGILRRMVERRLHLAERELGEVARETARVLEREVRCGARTRRGTSCAAPRVRGRARCKLHGGASTGPRTPEGKARSLAALQAATARRVAARRGANAPSSTG